jgi:hypothetical protein
MSLSLEVHILVLSERNNLMFWLVLGSHGTWSGGLIQSCVLPLRAWHFDVRFVLCALLQWLDLSVLCRLPHIRTGYGRPAPKSSFAGLSTLELFLANKERNCRYIKFPSYRLIFFDVDCWNGKVATPFDFSFSVLLDMNKKGEKTAETDRMQWNLGFHKMLGIPWVAEQLLASQEELSSM